MRSVRSFLSVGAKALCRDRRNHAPSASPGSEAGETSIVLTFVILAMLTLGGVVLAVLALGGLRGARDIRASTEALYAADTAIEMGLTHFVWSVPYDGDDTNFCTMQADVPIVGRPGVSFDIIVTGDPAPVILEPDRTEDDGTKCPTTEAEVRDGTRELCITAIGKARDGAVRRKIQYDTDPARCRP